MTQQQPQQQQPQSQQQLTAEQKKSGEENLEPVVDSNILRRNNRGCKSKEFYNWPEQPFEDMDSPLAVQQYIQQVIRRDPSDVDEILRLPEGQDLGAWKIEHLRLFCMQLNGLAVKLQDCCQPKTCNQMTATEQWIFLCAAHKQPNECPAIDYTRHTLDGASSLLNSNKYFPSRVTIKESSVAKLSSVCRRVYRIFSHAYYHHFQIFDEFERETHLCKRFSKFVTIYELMSKDSLIVPSDGSKPEVEPQQTAAPEKDSAVQQPDLNEDVPSKLQEASNKSELEVKPENQIKSDTNQVKKALDDASSNQSPKSTSNLSWPASQISTNTIVKGSSINMSAATSKENAEQSLADGETTPTIPLTTVPVGNSPKNGVESEA